jgi:thiol:disulfide interchange protein
MALSRRSFLAASLLACARAACAADAPLLPAYFDPARDPARDLAAALEIARASRRRVLVDVGGEWCSWCHVLDRFFAANPELERLRANGFVWLKINWSKEQPNEAFLRRWPKIDGYPHLFVLGADGRLLHSQETGVLESGRSYDPVAVRAFLLQWSP